MFRFCERSQSFSNNVRLPHDLIPGMGFSVSHLMQSQETTTRDFTYSVSEFTSSTGSIHLFLYVNSPDSMNKFGVSTRVYREIASFSCDDMYQYQSNRTSSDSVRLVTRGRTRVFMWIHIKTHTGEAVPIKNQYDMCQLVQKWFLVCWDASFWCKLYLQTHPPVFWKGSVCFGWV